VILPQRIVRDATLELCGEFALPKYFIDLQDGDFAYPDEEGSDLAGFEEARNEAITLLSQVARERLPDGEHREFVTTVRDEGGIALYRASLTFYGERLS